MSDRSRREGGDGRPGAVMRGRRAAAWLLFALALLAAQPRVAPAAPPSPDAAAAPGTGADLAELESLVSDLEDEGRRTALVRQLRALIEARRAAEAKAPPTPRSLGARLLETTSARLGQVTDRLVQGAGALVEIPRLIARARAVAEDPQRRLGWLVLAGKLALVLVAGVLTEMAARRLLARPLAALEGRDAAGFWERAPLLAARGVLDVLTVAAFAAAAYGVLTLVEPRPQTRVAALALIYASVVARALLAAGRAVLAPRARALRMLPVDDETANYWYLWLRRLANVGVYGYFGVEAVLALGAPAGLHALLADALGLVVTGMLAVLVLQNRHDVAGLIRGAPAPEGGRPRAGLVRRRLAEVWHVLAVLYLLAMYTVWALDVPNGFAYLGRASALTLVIAAAAIGAGAALHRAVRRLFALGAELSTRYPGLEARANRYVPALERGGRTLVNVVAALAVGQAWGLDTFGWLASGPGRELVGRLVTVVFIVVAALAAWELLSSLIERQLERLEASDAARSTRLRTLLPLARKALFVALAVMVTLTVLSELGIDIGPLLAGAGVAGLAIGFGAQTLVKDLITGVFILLEDSIAIGDYVDVGGHSGTVESLSIRTIRLRDPSGNVHTVPFSEVTTVLNYTREFGYAMMDVGVAYREDVDEVMEVLRGLGEELQADPDWGPRMLEPIQVLGLQELADSAVVIRARIKTTPGDQWATRREFQRRMKKRFDELGIEIPFPHRTVYFGVDKDGAAPPARVRLEDGAAPATE